MIHLPMVLRCMVYTLTVIVLARPQTYNAWDDKDTEGIDIMLTMDVSASMLTEDVYPNRMVVAKEVASEFISGRPNDNIGLVTFAGESFTACPLTQDHASLINRLQQLTPGIIEDQTAIGTGLATAVGRLKDSKTKSKVIILLTDGVNNAGSISPKMAAELAHTFDIAIYTIGVGTDVGEAPYPIPTPLGTIVRNMPVELDEPTMQLIADISGGSYFRATDNKSLNKIYQHIDELEKTKLTTRNYQHRYEKYALFALLALLLLLLEFTLRTTLLRTNP